ncbi:MAG TPA: dockerin type I domain-containing protein [Pseudobacteroides sp.]|uniref:dockerin type I domain-containing protein n=1 Tax=Pseudobacteroides sp. TaxID=1968840 RepID=UPI002F92E1AB
MKKVLYSLLALLLILTLSVMLTTVFIQAASERSISFGTTLNAEAQMRISQTLAKSIANPSSSQWRAKGDQHRTYFFSEANTTERYRLCVPTNWDGNSKLPLVMFLHGAGNDESSYLDQNNKQMVNLAMQHGYILVSPMGHTGAYGNFLRLSAPFGKPVEAAALMAQVTTASERTNELSEMDVINVLEIVLNEYPIDTSSVFLTGHSMGSGGTWYIGGKYSKYWAAIAPMSGPFVQETGYPWDNIRNMPIFITEGTQAPSLNASRLLDTWMTNKGYRNEYKEVNADHPGMVSLVLPDVFNFFDRCRISPTTPPTVTPAPTHTSTPTLSPTSKPTSEKSIDLDHNGVINMSDVILVAKAFNTIKGNTGYIEAYDLNNDGAINMTDIIIIAAKFNTIL